VKDHASSQNELITTSGQVVGVRTEPRYELLLGDSKGDYVLVTFARAFTDQFAPVFTGLKNGDTVIVQGKTRLVQGVLVTSSSGAMIEMTGVNLANAPTFAAIDLTDIRKTN